jgi:hypothetical protein
MKTKTDTVFRYALAIVITLAVFYLLGALKSMVVPDMWRDTYIMIVGVVIGKWSTIVDYYWGTSKSSSDKTDLLNNKPSQTI